MDDENNRKDDDPTADWMAWQMHQHSQRLMGNPRRGKEWSGPRHDPTGRTGRGSWDSPRQPDWGRPWDGRPRWEQGDYGHRLIDQMTQLAEEAVRGAGELAYRLADVAASLPSPRALPQLPLPGFPYSPYPDHERRPPTYGTGPAPGPVTPPTLTLGSVARGGTGRGELDLQNTTYRAVCNMRLHCSALVGTDGQTITGDHLSLAPPVVTLGPWETTRVLLMLSVPPDAVAGRYIGLIEGDGDGIQCLVTVTVG